MEGIQVVSDSLFPFFPLFFFFFFAMCLHVFEGVSRERGRVQTGCLRYSASSGWTEEVETLFWPLHLLPLLPFLASPLPCRLPLLLSASSLSQLAICPFMGDVAGNAFTHRRRPEISVETVASMLSSATVGHNLFLATTAGRGRVVRTGATRWTTNSTASPR